MDYPALELIDFHAWQDQNTGNLIRGLNARVAQGETFAFLSRCPKTRQLLVDSLIGRHPHKHGSIRILNSETSHLDEEAVYGFGMIYCDPDSGIVPHLNCEENLLLPPLGPNLIGGGLPLLEIFLLFPKLKDSQLALSSSLEPWLRLQLSWARALRTGANILILKNLGAYLVGAHLEQAHALLTRLNQRNYTIILMEAENSDLLRYVNNQYSLEKWMPIPTLR